MKPFPKIFRLIAQDCYGGIITTELVLLATVGAIGLATSLVTVRDAAISEISDVAGSVQDFNQQYLVFGSTGHSGQTAGSDYTDELDHCDDNEDVADAIDNCVIFTPPEDESSIVTISQLFEAESNEVQKTTGISYGDGWNLFTNGEVFIDFEIVDAGIYEFSSSVWGQRGGPELPNGSLLVNNVEHLNFDATATSHDTADHFCVDVFVPAGTNRFSIRFNNDHFNPALGEDSNLLIDSFSISGPN